MFGNPAAAPSSSSYVPSADGPFVPPHLTVEGGDKISVCSTAINYPGSTLAEIRAHDLGFSSNPLVFSAPSNAQYPSDRPAPAPAPAPASVNRPNILPSFSSDPYDGYSFNDSFDGGLPRPPHPIHFPTGDPPSAHQIILEQALEQLSCLSNFAGLMQQQINSLQRTLSYFRNASSSVSFLGPPNKYGLFDSIPNPQFGLYESSPPSGFRFPSRPAPAPQPGLFGTANPLSTAPQPGIFGCQANPLSTAAPQTTTTTGGVFGSPAKPANAAPQTTAANGSLFPTTATAPQATTTTGSVFLGSPAKPANAAPQTTAANGSLFGLPPPSGLFGGPSTGLFGGPSTGLFPAGFTPVNPLLGAPASNIFEVRPTTGLFGTVGSTPAGLTVSKDKTEKWICPCCETENDGDTCSVCLVAKPSRPLSSIHIGEESDIKSLITPKLNASPTKTEASATSKSDDKDKGEEKETQPKAEAPATFSFGTTSPTKPDTAQPKAESTSPTKPDTTQPKAEAPATFSFGTSSPTKPDTTKQKAEAPATFTFGATSPTKPDLAEPKTEA